MAHHSFGWVIPGGWDFASVCVGRRNFKQLAADRKAKGFNVIQIVAGLYPDMLPFDPRGANEGAIPGKPITRASARNILTLPTSACVTW